MGRFILKHIDNRKPKINISSNRVKEISKKEESNPTLVANENNNVVKEQVMTTNEKIAMAQNVLDGANATKRIKRDKGLIERTESSKTILTEDNKELLND